MQRFDGQVALVTGGGTGIGRAIASMLLAEGARVVVVGRREQPLQALQAESPERVRYMVADVTAPGAPGEIVKFAVEQFGGLHVLVNNAGSSILKPLQFMEEDDIDQLIAVNLKAVLLMARAALPHLIESRGSVINVTSTMADVAAPALATYSATKAGVQQLTRCLAVELGPQGVRVNAVAPGLTRTELAEQVAKDMPPGFLDQFVEQTPLGRMGEPQDIARAVLFLACSDASWLTGQVVQSSGGLMI